MRHPLAGGAQVIARAAWALGGLAVVYCALVAPNHPAAVGWRLFVLFPLELPALIAALLIAPRRAARWAAAAFAGVLGLLVLTKAVDFAMFTALARSFNPVGDFPLIAAAWNLASGTIGRPLAALIVLGAGVGTVVMIWLFYRIALSWARIDLAGPARAAALCMAVGFAGLSGYEAGGIMGRWSLPHNPPGEAFSLRLLSERVVTTRRSLDDLRAFQIAALTDEAAETPGLFARLDRDVLILFIESYGRASHDIPLYAPLHRQTLAAAQEAIGAQGAAMRSGFVRAPTQGGQSWLSHISFATGLWVTNQTTYAAALSSERRGLFHLAQEAGFHTAAVMPAITMAWPEAARMGFDTVLPAADLGYAGLPFNWVTLPDQFTLSVVDRRLRTPGPRAPLFAQIALISSHAPWVPVPEMVSWDAVGDGRIFDAMAQSGDPPEVVWRDRDRVRSQYRDAVDYALTAATAYAARVSRGPDAPLIFIVGDHQAAGFVAQDDRPDVPVHVIGPPHLVDRVADWGWRPGLLPDTAAPVMRMDEIRDRFIGAFSKTPAGQPRG